MRRVVGFHGDQFEIIYNGYIRKAMDHCEGYQGWDRAKKIYEFFCGTDHPHPKYTYQQMAINRRSDRQFSIDLMHCMAYLVTLNECCRTDC